MLAGESLGGAVAIDLAASNGARALIVERSFSSLKDAATHHYPKLAWLVPNGKLDSAAQISYEPQRVGKTMISRSNHARSNPTTC